MLIDLLITEIETGGAERCCAELAIYLARRGSQVRVISIGPPPQGSAKSLLWEKLKQVAEDLQNQTAAGTSNSKGELQIHFLNASKPWQWIRAQRGLRRLIEDRKPDVAQGFLWHANVLGGLLYGRTGVIWVPGIRVVEPRTWRRWLGWIWHKPASRVVCVSAEVAAWSHSKEGVPSEKLMVIENGVRIPPTSRTWAQPSAREPSKQLLFVGRLELQKGIDVLLRNAERILQALPDYRLSIIGEGSWMAAWKSFLESSPFSHRIDLLGKQSNVLEKMLESDLLILPTRYEGMPNVILEAMSVGLPVATMRVEGVAALLGEQLEAQSVVREDWEGWVRLVIDLVRQGDKLQYLGSANRERAANHFELEHQLRKYESLYETLYRELACHS
jgi:glycosyltransferase involved in cell wall biosynthesis